MKVRQIFARKRTALVTALGATVLTVAGVFNACGTQGFRSAPGGADGATGVSINTASVSYDPNYGGACLYNFWPRNCVTTQYLSNIDRVTDTQVAGWVCGISSTSTYMGPKVGNVPTGTKGSPGALYPYVNGQRIRWNADWPNPFVKDEPALLATCQIPAEDEVSFGARFTFTITDDLRTQYGGQTVVFKIASYYDDGAEVARFVVPQPAAPPAPVAVTPPPPVQIIPPPVTPPPTDPSTSTPPKPPMDVYPTPVVSDAGTGVAWVPLWRFFRPSTGEHFITASMSEGLMAYWNAGGFTAEGMAFNVATAQFDGSTPIYRCLIDASSMHFISGDPGCEGNRTEGLYGYLYAAAGAGRTAVYRRYNPSNGDHLITTGAAEGQKLGYTNEEGVLGYTR